MDITPELIAKKLNAAADLIETKGWTKGHYAITSTGRECNPDSKSACCFCVEGAFIRVCRVLGKRCFELRFTVSNAFDRFVGASSIDWNDTRRSAKPVIAALRGAARQVLADA